MLALSKKSPIKVSRKEQIISSPLKKIIWAKLFSTSKDNHLNSFYLVIVYLEIGIIKMP